MNFNWFHLMPYRFLPEDFRRNIAVCGSMCPAISSTREGHQLYHEFLDEMEYAEQVGFDGICCNEHHNNAYGLMPSPNLIAAALTRRTSRAALIVLGNSLALYNPPIRVAEEFAMLDVMSGGRLVAGFPVGRRWIPTSPMARCPPRCATSITRRMTSSSRPGRARSLLPSMANIRSYATLISGRARSRSHTRRSDPRRWQH